MKPKFTLVVALFLAMLAGAVTPISASAHERHRVHVYFYYGSQPRYYYQPAPAYYYPETTYYSYRPVRWHRRWEEREHWRRYHRWHRDWDRDGD